MLFILERMVRAANRAASAMICLIALIALCYSLYALYDIFSISEGAYISQDLMQFKPMDSAESGGMEALRAVNPAARGWLTVDSTAIDYPVMQGSDDTTYAYTDPYGKPSLSGSIYLSYVNSGDFADSYNMLYGHHMVNDAMFGGLDHFKSMDYLESHRTGTLVTPDRTYTIDLFACMETDAYDPEIYGIDQWTEDNMPEMEAFIAEHAEHYIAPESTYAKMIALSTCADTMTNGRIVVFGHLQELEAETLTGNTYNKEEKPNRKSVVIGFSEKKIALMNLVILCLSIYLVLHAGRIRTKCTLVRSEHRWHFWCMEMMLCLLTAWYVLQDIQFTARYILFDGKTSVVIAACLTIMLSEALAFPCKAKDVHDQMKVRRYKRMNRRWVFAYVMVFMLAFVLPVVTGESEFTAAPSELTGETETYIEQVDIVDENEVDVQTQLFDDIGAAFQMAEPAETEEQADLLYDEKMHDQGADSGPNIPETEKTEQSPETKDNSQGSQPNENASQPTFDSDVSKTTEEADPDVTAIEQISHDTNQDSEKQPDDTKDDVPVQSDNQQESEVETKKEEVFAAELLLGGTPEDEERSEDTSEKPWQENAESHLSSTYDLDVATIEISHDDSFAQAKYETEEAAFSETYIEQETVSATRELVKLLRSVTLKTAEKSYGSTDREWALAYGEHITVTLFFSETDELRFSETLEYQVPENLTLSADEARVAWFSADSQRGKCAVDRNNELTLQWRTVDLPPQLCIVLDGRWYGEGGLWNFGNGVVREITVFDPVDDVGNHDRAESFIESNDSDERKSLNLSLESNDATLQDVSEILETDIGAMEGNGGMENMKIEIGIASSNTENMADLSSSDSEISFLEQNDAERNEEDMNEVMDDGSDIENNDELLHGELSVEAEVVYLQDDIKAEDAGEDPSEDTSDEETVMLRAMEVHYINATMGSLTMEIAGLLPSNVYPVVSPVTAQIPGEEVLLSFDLAFYKEDGTEYVPDEAPKVTLHLPENFEDTTLHVYRVGEGKTKSVRVWRNDQSFIFSAE
ncbi:MAG: sortase [Clostridia bacterium]|nr:sortase [Clostridia bacterium]